MIGPGIPNPLMFSGGDPLDELGKIDKSLRLRASASASLSKTFAASGNRKTWSLRLCYKMGMTSSHKSFLSVDANNFFRHRSTDALQLTFGGTNTFDTQALFRDPSAHMDILLAVDTTQATSIDRIKIYVNGVQQALTVSGSWPALNADLSFNNAVAHSIGGLSGSPMDGLLSHYAFVDGAALTPTAFGQFHQRTGQWRPKSRAAIKAVVDAGGVNSFFLPFDDATSLATLTSDASSKANHWMANNISLTAGVSYDSLLDTPTINFPIINQNFAANGFIAGNITDGGLKFSSSTTYHLTPCTIPLPTYGKWCAEFIPQDTVSFIGLADLDNGSGASQNIGNGLAWYGTVLYTGNASAVQSGLPAMVANDIITVAVDMDALQASWYKNGTLAITQALAGGKRYAFACGDYYAPGPTSCFANFGQRPFSHQPAGYKPLSAKNLKYDSTAQTSTSGTFIGNGAADGPSVYINGCPETLTINGNAVVFGVHADRLANGFKIRTASASYNAGGSNTWSATLNSAPLKSLFRFQNAKGN